MLINLKLSSGLEKAETGKQHMQHTREKLIRGSVLETRNSRLSELKLKMMEYSHGTPQFNAVLCSYLETVLNPSDEELKCWADTEASVAMAEARSSQIRHGTEDCLSSEAETKDSGGAQCRCQSSCISRGD